MYPMLRYLRIAWTAACGIAVLLLIMLWVRSFWRADALIRFDRMADLTILDPKGERSTVIESCGGRVFAIIRSPNSSCLVWGYESEEARPRYRRGVAWGRTKLGELWIDAPMYGAVCIMSALAAVPWVFHARMRFSVSTLLAATTAAAVIFGVIAWATRG